MPNMKNAKKKIKVIAKKNESNNNYEASMRTATKKVEKAVIAKDKDKAVTELKSAVKKIDKAVSKGVIKENNGSRKKSNLYTKVNNME